MHVEAGSRSSWTQSANNIDPSLLNLINTQVRLTFIRENICWEKKTVFTVTIVPLRRDSLLRGRAKEIVAIVCFLCTIGTSPRENSLRKKRPLRFNCSCAAFHVPEFDESRASQPPAVNYVTDNAYKNVTIFLRAYFQLITLPFSFEMQWKCNQCCQLSVNDIWEHQIKWINRSALQNLMIALQVCYAPSPPPPPLYLCYCIGIWSCEPYHRLRTASVLNDGTASAKWTSISIHNKKQDLAQTKRRLDHCSVSPLPSFEICWRVQATWCF